MAAGTIVLLLLLTACLPPDRSDRRIEGMTASEQRQELQSRPSIDEAVTAYNHVLSDAVTRLARLGLTPWLQEQQLPGGKDAERCYDFHKLTSREARSVQLTWRRSRRIEPAQWDAAVTAVADAARQAGFAEWPDPARPPGQYYSMRDVHDAHLSFQSDIDRQTNDAGLSIQTGCSLTTK